MCFAIDQRFLKWCYTLILFLSRLEYLILCTICLFVWGFTSHSRIVRVYRDFTITGEGLLILIYTRHSWPLSSEGTTLTRDIRLYYGHLMKILSIIHVLIDHFDINNDS